MFTAGIDHGQVQGESPVDRTWRARSSLGNCRSSLSRTTGSSATRPPANRHASADEGEGRGNVQSRRTLNAWRSGEGTQHAKPNAEKAGCRKLRAWEYSKRRTEVKTNRVERGITFLILLEMQVKSLEINARSKIK